MIAIAIRFRDIKRLWLKFRDHKPEKYKEIHDAYCVTIQKAIGANDVNESLRLLTEGILFFNVPGENDV
jgi:hypothetical protein